nr:MAG TPA: hypothetical protein [Caudoviricetes sp.]
MAQDYSFDLPCQPVILPPFPAAPKRITDTLLLQVHQLLH